MGKFFALANSAERVVVHLRKGSYTLKPMKDEAKKKAKRPPPASALTK